MRLGDAAVALSPVLPQILTKLGYLGAMTLFSTMASSDAEHSRMRWQGIDDTVIDAFSRIPLAGTRLQHICGSPRDGGVDGQRSCRRGGVRTLAGDYRPLAGRSAPQPEIRSGARPVCHARTSVRRVRLSRQALRFIAERILYGEPAATRGPQRSRPDFPLCITYSASPVLRCCQLVPGPRRGLQGQVAQSEEETALEDAVESAGPERDAGGDAAAVEERLLTAERTWSRRLAELIAPPSGGASP